MALVIALFVCKSDLKAVLVEQNLEKTYTNLVQPKEKSLGVKCSLGRRKRLNILTRLIALVFLVMLIS